MNVTETARKLVDPPENMSDDAFVLWMAHQIRDLRIKAYGAGEAAEEAHIPPQPVGRAADEVRAIQVLNFYMETKFEEHRRKGGWDSMTTRELHKRMLDEMEELRTTLLDYWERGASVPVWCVHAVLYELADVANFAAIMADILVERHDLLVENHNAPRWAKRVKYLEAQIQKARLALDGML